MFYSVSQTVGAKMRQPGKKTAGKKSPELTFVEDSTEGETGGKKHTQQREISKEPLL